MTTRRSASPSSKALTALIRDRIRRDGPLTYAVFQQMALSTPGLGYYDQQSHSPGRQGDFYTSVSVGPLFGELLARQFADWLTAGEMPQKPCSAGGKMAGDLPPRLLEAGAHDGKLAGDILAWLRRARPSLYDRIEYWIMEPSERQRSWQQERLAEFSGRVRWLAEWEQVPSLGWEGIVFSNELLDSFPAHRLGWDASRHSWFEWGVRETPDGLGWCRMELPSNSPANGVATPAGWSEDLPDNLLNQLPDGFTIEISPATANWWRNAARALRRGWLVTLDYGLAAFDFLQPHRVQGTARAYRSHQVTADLLAAPGDQDLTAHVNWTVLQTVGEAEGLHTLELVSQQKFLLRVVQSVEDAPMEARQVWTLEQRRQLRTLTHPEFLGTRFQVLVQTRGVS